MTERVIISGHGGQGIMLMGKLLAQAALKSDKRVTWLPAYGAEVRGGASYCMIIISDEEIPSPFVTQADTLIAMNAPSLERFKNLLSPKGLLVVNTSLTGGSLTGVSGEIVKVACTDIATKLGNIKVANTVALGAYVAAKKIVSKKAVFEAMQAFAPKGRQDLIDINLKALEEGMKYDSR